MEQPDVIVSLQSGAVLAQQFFDYDHVLICPDYQVSKVLKTLLNEEYETMISYLFDRLDVQQHPGIDAN